MTIINGRMLFLPSKINKSKKLNIKNIALSLFSVLSFFLSHLRIAVIYKYTKPHSIIICVDKNKKPINMGPESKNYFKSFKFRMT